MIERPSPFTAEDVLEWAKTKDPEERYRYSSSTQCVLAQFLKEKGFSKNPNVGPWDWNTLAEYDYTMLPEIFHDAKWMTGDDRDGGETKITTFGTFVTGLEGALNDLSTAS